MKGLFTWVLAILLLSGCSENLSVEQQVIATLRNMEYAAEEGEHFEFMSYVSESFSGQQAAMDRRQFHRFMIFQLNRNRRLQAQFFPIFVEQTGPQTATAHFRILVTGGDGLLPERGQVYQVETNWIVPDGQWLLESANWDPVAFVDAPADGS